MINKEQFIKCLLKPTLEDCNLYSKEASNLIWGTMCVESNCFHIRQKGCYAEYGAFGFIQMELATAKDIIDNFIRYRPELLKSLNKYYNKDLSLKANLTGNLQFQVFMCRVHYLRVPTKIPRTNTVGEPKKYVTKLAKYWKEHYNTRLGAGEVSDFLEAWR